MQVFWVISKTINSLQIPYFILTVIILSIFLLRPSKTTFLLIGIAFYLFTWRLFFDITSSRYCASFLVYGIVTLSVFAKKIKKNRPVTHLILLGFLILATYNTSKAQGSFRNIYIYDAKNLIQGLSTQKGRPLFMIEGKEFNRLKVKDSNNADMIIAWKPDCRTVSEILNKYSLSGIEIYIVTRNNVYNDKTVTLPIGTRLRHEALFYTDHQKKKNLSFYHYTPNHVLPYTDLVSNRKVSNNIIKNGDIETVLSHEQTVRSIKKWIDQGATFYVSDDIKLPHFKELLETWRTIDRSSCPFVYADSENVINGSYSLRIILPHANRSNILLSNRIKTEPGFLSFLVKPMSNKCEFVVSRFDFMPGKFGIIPPFSSYTFRLSTKEYYLIEIPLDNATINGTETLFCIMGNDLDILIDDIDFLSDR